MKKIILCTLVSLFTVVCGQPNKDSQNKEDLFEQLMKEFEEIIHNPSSPEQYTWFARCAKNEECRKSAQKKFEKIPKEELTDMMIDSMALNGQSCIVIREIQEYQKKLGEDLREIQETQKEIDNRVNKSNKLEKGYRFVVGGLLTSGGALCIFNNDNIVVNMLGTFSVTVGLFSFLRSFIE